MWLNSIIEAIGNTPLVRLSKLSEGIPATVLAKVESFNPGGSVKDRIGVAMIEAAERDGKLKPGGTIIECTSGNTGAGLALAAIVKGYKCIFTTTDKQSAEKVDVLRALGAEVHVCPTNVDPEDPKSYYSIAARLAKEIPNSFHMNQYDNPSNAVAHYETTGPELWEQTEGKITHFIAGAGTGGTISGTAKYLKEKNSDIKIVGVDPLGSVYYKYFKTGEFDENEIYPYVTEGVGEDILAGNMDFSLIDDYVQVSDRDSLLMTRRLSREEGLFVGGSCGMAMAGALDYLKSELANLSEDDVAVVLLPDSGFRYLSKIFNDRWMENHGFMPTSSGLDVEAVLGRQTRETMISALPDQKLSDVIASMAEHGISQLPVLSKENEVLGSISESEILAQLIEDPNSKDLEVSSVMGEPFPVISRTLQIEELSTYLDAAPGAVLVRSTDASKSLNILTKADLIKALATPNRTI